MTARPDEHERSIGDRLGPLAGRPAIVDALALVGAPGSRHAIATPALVVDLDALTENIATAQRLAAEASVGLRPHAKTHKSAAIARLQIEAGAVGVCVAKLAEAEALAAAGIGSLLVTSPVHERLVDRVARLHATGCNLTVVVDDGHAVAPLARATASSGPLDVLIDLDVGLHRTGVPGPAAAARLAAAVHEDPALHLAGVQAYGGHWQHIADPVSRRGAVVEGMEILATCVEAIEAAGLPVGLRTGGGTGTFPIDLELGALDEVQPGSYVVMDREYSEALAGDVDNPWQQALFVDATVVSARHDGFVTVDAGLKAFATDAGEPACARSTYVWFGDEHGLVTQPEGTALRVGDRVELVPPHCDPTIDRFDVMHVVRGDTLVDILPIEGRGCSQ